MLNGGVMTKEDAAAIFDSSPTPGPGPGPGRGPAAGFQPNNKQQQQSKPLPSFQKCVEKLVMD